LKVVAMPGKLCITIASIVGGGILRSGTLKVLRFLWRTNRVSRSIHTQLNVVGRAVLSSKSLMTRPHPAQDGEDEVGESDQCSQATEHNGEVTGIVVDRDRNRLEVGGGRFHDCVVLAGGCVVKGLANSRSKAFANEMIEVMAEDKNEHLLKY
jgi:hypothetical protein